MDNNELSAAMREWQRQLEPLRETIKQIDDLKIVVDTSAVRLALSDTANLIREFRERERAVFAEIAEFQESYKGAIKEISSYFDQIRNITIPHMALYRNIVNSIDLEKIQGNFSKQEEEKTQDEVNIVRPFFYDASVKINIYIAFTDDVVKNNPNVNEEDKTAWEKYLKPILIYIAGLFMAWTLGDTPIKDTIIFQQLEKIIEVIEEYKFPIETIDASEEFSKK